MENKIPSPQEASSLMPCPFCGSEAEIESACDGDEGYSWIECGCGVLRRHEDDAELEKSWNTRPREQTLLQALKKAKEALETCDEREEEDAVWLSFDCDKVHEALTLIRSLEGMEKE